MRLLLDVLISGPRCAIYGANLYLTCKMLYAKLPDVRDAILLQMILSHSVKPEVAAKSESVQWGDVKLYLCHKDDIYKTYRPCGKTWEFICSWCLSKQCEVFDVDIPARRDIIGQIYLYKRDIFNNIHYCFKSFNDYSTTISCLYDCSQLSKSRRHVSITIGTSKCRYLEYRDELYEGYINVSDATDSAPNVIDGKRIVFVQSNNRFSADMINFVNNNAAAIIQYMRSSHIIDSRRHFKALPECMMRESK